MVGDGYAMGVAAKILRTYSGLRREVLHDGLHLREPVIGKNDVSTFTFACSTSQLLDVMSKHYNVVAALAANPARGEPPPERVIFWYSFVSIEVLQ